MTSCDLQAAIVIGMIAGAGYTSMEHMLVSWQIDDPVGSFPVHYVGGFLGVILTPIFANHEQPYSWVYWKGTNLILWLEPLHHICFTFKKKIRQIFSKLSPGVFGLESTSPWYAQT